MDEVPFTQLSGQDLVVDRLYCGGSAPGAGSDPVYRLLPGLPNVGGFRVSGSVVKEQTRLVVLYTSGEEGDWPDVLDPATGDFAYYGDNRSPGRGLHETPHKGNLLLRNIFEWSHAGPEARAKVPPILLFQKAGRGRDVYFRGLLVPGSPRLTSDEELVAVWRTTQEKRFQNYRAHFTVLDVDRLPRTWLDDVLAGHPLGATCPPAWRRWVAGRVYVPLLAPRTTVVRPLESQLPDPSDAWITAQVHRHFSLAPTQFEHLAARVWMTLDPRATDVEITRPSVDGGRDGLGTYLIGPSYDPVRLEFALEAKCYGPTNGVGVKEVARLVSRIKHREFGVLVTTSYVSRQTYAEVREDRHPIVFVTGRDVAEALKKLGLTTPAALQAYLDEHHPITAEERAVEAGLRADLSHATAVDPVELGSDVVTQLPVER